MVGGFTFGRDRDEHLRCLTVLRRDRRREFRPEAFRAGQGRGGRGEELGGEALAPEPEALPEMPEEAPAPEFEPTEEKLASDTHKIDMIKEFLKR